MANLKKRVPENVAGDFFVDSTCIDCDACRQIAPAVFGEAAETSFVKAQPVSSADRRGAEVARAESCGGAVPAAGTRKARRRGAARRRRGARAPPPPQLPRAAR